MRVTIATRIYTPEPGAASFRLAALAEALGNAGYETLVLTVRPPKQLRLSVKEPGYRVRRWPVLRDSQGYVRGYLQYLSFDVPLFFRLLFGRKIDALIVEPPPTTLLCATVAARFRRVPVFAYAADVWSDATISTGAPAAVARTVRFMERFSWQRTRGVFAVNEGVASRVHEIAPAAVVEVIGNGIDTNIFTPAGDLVAPASDEQSAVRPYALYSGTASEWQGAEVFIHALSQLETSGTNLELIFLGQGTALPELRSLAVRLGVSVRFLDPVPPEKAADWMRGAAMSLASILPEAGYSFAFPTKIFAAWGSGVPVVYAGPGPARDTIECHPFLGEGIDHDATLVAAAMQRTLDGPGGAQNEIAAWAKENVSLARVAERAVDFVKARLRG